MGFRTKIPSTNLFTNSNFKIFSKTNINMIMYLFYAERIEIMASCMHRVISTFHVSRVEFKWDYYYRNPAEKFLFYLGGGINNLRRYLFV